MPKIAQPPPEFFATLQREKLDDVSEQIQRALIAVSFAKRALLIARRLEIHGRQPNGRIGAAFVKETAGELRLSEGTIYRDLNIVRRIGIAGLRRIEGTCLDAAAEIDALARLAPDERDQLIAAASRGKQVSALDR